MKHNNNFEDNVSSSDVSDIVSDLYYSPLQEMQCIAEFFQAVGIPMGNPRYEWMDADER